MDFSNCPRCGKLFVAISASICDECRKEEEAGFQRIKEYIENHPKCRLAELSEATGVTAKRILRYIKEGRLEISQGMKGDVTCESCNKPIARGRFCDTCLIQINHEVEDIFQSDKSPNDKFKGAKMHSRRKHL